MGAPVLRDQGADIVPAHALRLEGGGEYRLREFSRAVAFHKSGDAVGAFVWIVGRRHFLLKSESVIAEEGSLTTGPVDGASFDRGHQAQAPHCEPFVLL